MGTVWEAYHKGFPLLGVPGITLEVLKHLPTFFQMMTMFLNLKIYVFQVDFVENNRHEEHMWIPAFNTKTYLFIDMAHWKVIAFFRRGFIISSSVLGAKLVHLSWQDDF